MRAIPVDVREVGWWDEGSAPGQPGVAVLAGHRSAATQRYSALRNLPSLKPGARIAVEGTNGTTTVWRVARVQTVANTSLPGSLWSTTGPAELAVITCGGPFNARTGHYVDNVIVWAAPVPTN